MRKRPFVPYLLSAIGLVVVGAYLFPLYWMVTTAIKPSGQLFVSPPVWIPTHWDFSAFANVLGNPFLQSGLKNSFLISVGTTAVTLVLAAPAAYALARLRLRWTALLLVPFLVAQLLPTINIALPMFVLFSQVGLTNSVVGLILGNTVNTAPFAVIILRPFFLAIPLELEEAAELDGCGRFGAFFRVILPLARPGFVTVAAFSFVMAWGEFTLGLTLSPRREAQPVTVALNSFIGQYSTEWGPLMAASTIVAIPIVLLFVGLQRFITSGLSAGATKG